jgi:hypothetical protein
MLFTSRITLLIWLVVAAGSNPNWCPAEAEKDE